MKRIMAMAAAMLLFLTTFVGTAQAATTEKQTPSGIPNTDIGSSIEGFISEREAGLAFSYTAPITVLIHLCDRDPDKEAEAVDKMKKFIRNFIEEYEA